MQKVILFVAVLAAILSFPQLPLRMRRWTSKTAEVLREWWSLREAMSRRTKWLT